MEWEKLKFYQWATLIIADPKYAKKCDLDIIPGFEWAISCPYK